MNAAEFASRLQGARQAGEGWTAHCPSHDDQRSSLSFRDGNRGLLIKCHAGCALEAIAAALGLPLADLLHGNGGNPAARRGGTLIATYSYRDEHGAELFQVRRYDPKDFRQCTHTAQGEVKWNLKGVRRVLYHLPEVQKQENVYIVEGEKDVQSLERLGLVASTNAGGAGKWRQEYTTQLIDAGVKNLVVLPDNDEPGEAHARAVARSCLAAGLAVRIVRLPGLPEKCDVSDWLDCGGGKEELAALIEATPSLQPGDLEPSNAQPLLMGASEKGNGEGSEAPSTGPADHPYRIEGGRICRVRRMKDAEILEPLANFAATISEEVLQDDGVETSRAFVISGTLDTGQPLPPVRVPTSRYPSMTWPLDHWGRAAVIRAGPATRDCLREAIQRLSPSAPVRRVYMHTGWRQVNNLWVFLSSTGAVGQDGFEVDLGSLSRYALPRDPENPREAMRASLRILHIAPLQVTAPLLGAVYRAPLAEPYPVDLSVLAASPTGNLKSSLAGVCQSHYGQFIRTTLPASWASTANALEKIVFTLKDVLVTIDDWAPTALDARELEAKAARVIRAQGNLAGRSRLRADLSERPGYAPRGLILSTGEQCPPGQSLLARCLVIEPDRREMNLELLTECQQAAPRLPHAMAAYVNWLAPQMPSLPGLLRETFEGARKKALDDGQHLRVPEALAHLWLGLHCAFSFAEEIEACSAGEAEDLRGRCWEALVRLGRDQARIVEEEKPVKRFVKVLLALLTQRRCILLPRQQDYDGNKGGPEFLGWQDETSLYLLPEAAFQAVSRFCREAGEAFPVREGRLRRDLVREGIAECDADRNTTAVWIAGGTRRVLKLQRQAVEKLAGEEIPLPVITTITGFQGER